MAETDRYTQLPEPVPAGEHGFGLVLVAPLSDDNRDRISTIKAVIERRIGAQLWTPHTDITLGHVLEMGREGTRVEWEQRYQRVFPLAAKALRAMAVTLAPFTSRFTTLQASPQAVVAVAPEHTDPVVELRRRFLDVLASVPDSTPRVKYIDFVHTTLGRYTAEGIPMDDVRRVVNEVQDDPRMPLPFDQVTRVLVLGEEPKRYELIPRGAVPLLGRVRM